MSKDISTFLDISPVIPVLTIARVDDAVALAQALAEGGLTVLEVTLRTEAALDAISAIARNVPKAIVGAGTVLTTADLENARNTGAKFAVSPGLTDALADRADAVSFPILPGVATASEIMRGRERGLRHFKFFPAESSGGVAALKSFAGPFSDVRFCPTGGITLETAPAYLALANVMCVGGSWMAPRRLIDDKDWKAITNLARGAAKLRV
ncbi:MAG TPA: bifunctional 4-hydroxy-2-oxoglutarate aldolase/2-dehydro-3-deoxy-phosphogluconate aldolase [Rhizomicrobium sp.]|jgi:2-dehydro-3-deoxyphosphogluconate aldolase/(4S)-4-hydroxy-2-oxoglutarate aldolase